MLHIQNDVQVSKPHIIEKYIYMYVCTNMLVDSQENSCNYTKECSRFILHLEYDRATLPNFIIVMNLNFR